MSHRTFTLDEANAQLPLVAACFARIMQAKAQLARAMEEEKHRDEIMEKKFREAVKKAEKEDTPAPPRPFDLD